METGFYTDERTGEVVQWRGLAPLARFFTKVVRNPETGCWEWVGTMAVNGYGFFRYGNHRSKPIHAHRWIYQQLVGPIKEGQVVSHLCENRRCANPSHLEATTQRANLMYTSATLASVNARKTHCVNGHSRWKVSTAGTRYCAECIRLYMQRKRAAADRQMVNEALQSVGLPPLPESEE